MFGYDDLQWGRIREGLSQLTGDLILRREIDLLEELGRDGDAARGLDLPERIVHVFGVVEVIALERFSQLTVMRLGYGTRSNDLRPP